MAWRIRWSRPAVGDLAAIRSFIAADSRHYANVLVAKLRRTIRSLRQFPMRGHVIENVTSPGLREVSVFPYRIIYQVRGETVWIVAILHGARQFAADDLLHRLDETGIE